MQEFGHEFADVWLKLPSPLLQKGGMRIVRAGRNIAKPHYHVGPKIIECHSLHFIMEGELLFEYNGQRKHLKAGDLFCLFPYLPYSYRIHDSGKPLRLMWLALEGSQVPEAVRSLHLSESEPFLENRLDFRVKAALHTLISLQEQRHSSDYIESSELYRLFDGLSRAHAPSASAVDHDHDIQRDWLDDSIDYLRLHYMEPIKIEELARLAGVNRTYYSTRFTQKTGASPMQYLQKLRMDKGAQLLLDTSLSITEIALSLGYPDLYSFTRAFKNYHGSSPSSFRDEL